MGPLTEEFDSLRYLKAGSEVFAFLIAGSWLLTYLYNPGTIEDNPLKRRIGYNNLCVGYDTPPAKYFAFFLWPVSTYFNIRFACPFSNLHSRFPTGGGRRYMDTQRFFHPIHSHPLTRQRCAVL